jgi:hypothetical protein
MSSFEYQILPVPLLSSIRYFYQILRTHDEYSSVLIDGYDSCICNCTGTCLSVSVSLTVLIVTLENDYVLFRRFIIKYSDGTVSS